MFNACNFIGSCFMKLLFQDIRERVEKVTEGTGTPIVGPYKDISKILEAIDLMAAALESAVKYHPVDQGNCIRDHYPDRDCDCFVSKCETAIAHVRRLSETK